MGGTPSSTMVIEDVDRALEASEIVFHANGSEFEGLADINRHRKKDIGEGKSVIWGVARTKGEGCECKLTKICHFKDIC